VGGSDSRGCGGWGSPMGLSVAGRLGEMGDGGGRLDQRSPVAFDGSGRRSLLMGSFRRWWLVWRVTGVVHLC
jgi:hypothetical protein